MTSENFHDGFYSIVDISNFTEFPYTALVLLWVSVVLFCYFSFCFVFFIYLFVCFVFFPQRTSKLFHTPDVCLFRTCKRFAEVLQ